MMPRGNTGNMSWKWRTKKMHETESITNALIEKANEKERQSEDLDRAISEKRSRLNKEKGSELLNAAVGWATGEIESPEK